MKTIYKIFLALIVFANSNTQLTAITPNTIKSQLSITKCFNNNGFLDVDCIDPGSYDIANYPIKLDPQKGIVLAYNTTPTDEFIPMGFGMNNDVLTMAVDRKGGVYVGGKFKKIGNLKVNHAAYWDGDKWNVISKEGFNDDVRSIVIDKNGTSDKVYFAGLFGKANDKKANKFYSLHDDSDLGISVGSADAQSVTIDTKHNIYVAGVIRHGLRAQRYYYIKKYNKGSWSTILDKGKNEIDMYGEQEIKITCTSNNDLIISAPKNGIYRLGNRLSSIKKLSDRGNMRVTNAAVNPINETIYFAIRNTKNHSTELFAHKKGNGSSSSVWKSNDIVALSISISSSGQVLYMGGGEHSTYNLIKLDLSDESNITSKEIKCIYNKNKKKAGDIYALAIPSKNDVIVGGKFQNIDKKMEAKNIVLYRQNISIKKSPPPAKVVKSMYVGGQKNQLIPGTVLTIEGAVSISSDDVDKPYAIDSEYLDDYLLWVEDGIVTEDLSFADPDEWSDYVFDPDYNLMDLHKLKTYIQKNGHLPGVPSEKEIIEKGYSVHDMNKRFMAKIEELVLYAIQLEERQKEDSKWNALITEELNQLRTLIKHSNKIKNKNHVEHK